MSRCSNYWKNSWMTFIVDRSSIFGRSQLSLRVGILCAIALFISSVISSIWIADNNIHNLDTRYKNSRLGLCSSIVFCPRLQVLSFPIFTMQFTLLASLAIVCGVAFAAPFTMSPGELVGDAVNNVGSTLQFAGAPRGDLSGALERGWLWCGEMML
ncbi:uncharacterized protein HD556DRAFT_846821 [Suillus plorans]|uniref:Uncharacterized protein n=1 Tax=Suillus plorans TaxID=116603 RepID=A0A9P7AHU8_9AGAM|nr:uncharacterized protein HD556DRAFT_846821 [Suillus plorans]KAG1788780.1 hypothetical protein HD556DRAFT_846821 [Suillus plorans]